nr:SAV_6107 family HEPN domain-containing protein [Actinocatenispora comari]
MPHRSAHELLALARRGLIEAAETRSDGQRYATAHLAALRAAAAVLVSRARPTPARRRRPTNVWALLSAVAPELSQWADRFAAGAAKRSAAEAGLRVVSTVEADDLRADAERFVAVVELSLGLPHQPLITARAS